MRYLPKGYFNKNSLRDMSTMTNTLDETCRTLEALCNAMSSGFRSSAIVAVMLQ